MLCIVKNGTKEILFRVDAWDTDCEIKAINFLRDHNLRCTKDEITSMGDRLVWVD